MGSWCHEVSAKLHHNPQPIYLLAPVSWGTQPLTFQCQLQGKRIWPCYRVLTSGQAVFCGRLLLLLRLAYPHAFDGRSAKQCEKARTAQQSKLRLMPTLSLKGCS